jgi:hypothetical protein
MKRPKLIKSLEKAKIYKEFLRRPKHIKSFEKAQTYKEFLNSVKKNLIVISYVVPVTLSSLMMTRYEPKRVADSVV